VNSILFSTYYCFRFYSELGLELNSGLDTPGPDIARNHSI